MRARGNSNRVPGAIVRSRAVPDLVPWLVAPKTIARLSIGADICCCRRGSGSLEGAVALGPNSFAFGPNSEKVALLRSNLLSLRRVLGPEGGVFVG